MPHIALAWSVHIFTASGVICGFLACLAIQQGDWERTLYCLLVALLIDSVDGTFARKYRVRDVLPRIDGRMLDYVVDFVNFVFIPALFIYAAIELPDSLRLVLVGLILLASCYHYANLEAVLKNTFFIGFPAFWNIVAVYLFVLGLSPWWNAALIVSIVVTHFVPIKFLYLSRFFYTTKCALPLAMTWFGSTFLALFQYPNGGVFWVCISLIMAVLYVLLSNIKAPLTLVKES